MRLKAALPPAVLADTRRRLIEAAGRVFADKGYRAATVREIIRLAGVNLAAVNYHFRGKEGLYAAVLEQTYVRALEKHPPEGGVDPHAGPAERLFGFIRSFLERIFDEEAQACYGKLMARELVEPTAALDEVADRIRPLFGRLCGIVGELLGPGADPGRIDRSAKSVVGQILFYKHAAPVLERLEGRRRGRPDIEALARHIADFSLHGLGGSRPGTRRSR
ncbi:MAG TPA: CerR family C-terminal domain-containing protein [Planctomycetota bacterium]|nr:CerR family C-terminal domain-containing protein [Planctomycetota bacterium]